MEVTFIKTTNKGHRIEEMDGMFYVYPPEGGEPTIDAPYKLPKPLTVPAGLTFTHAVAGILLTTREASVGQAARDARAAARAKADRYDDLYNEGAEGFNPYR
jgi:hypothetical protein